MKQSIQVISILIIILALLVCILLSPPISARAEIAENESVSAKYIKANVKLNVRTAPSSSAPIVGSVLQNDVLQYVNEKDGWIQTTYRGKTAYVSGNAKYTTTIELKKQSQKVEKAITSAEQMAGSAYVYGATRLHDGNGNLNSKFSNTRFDCSSFTQYAFQSSGVNLKGTTREQSLQGKLVKDGELKRGDLLFFTNSERANLKGIERIGHVGIYLGDNYIVHSSSKVARIEQISSTRWGNFITARRVI
ncbi:MAG: SH3 domain-containing C40 family peptidase [Clostridia bacterium]